MSLNIFSMFIVRETAAAREVKFARRTHCSGAEIELLTAEN